MSRQVTDKERDRVEAQLPQWAQRLIFRLEKDVIQLEEKLARTSEGDTEVWVENYDRPNDPLPPGSRVRFQTFDGDEFSAAIRDGFLDVYCIGARLLVRPESANRVSLRGE